MGNLSCYNPQPLKQPQAIQPQQQSQPDSDLLDVIDYSHHLQQQVKNKFFVQFKKDKGIESYIGISLQNLSQLYNFVSDIKHDNVHMENVSAASKDSVETDIKTECEIIIDQVKTALFQLKKNTKKHSKALNVSEQKNSQNHIDLPYFLPWITTKKSTVCIYIGQWKYQNKYFHKNFPFGIGRVYLNNEVWQGSIQCTLSDDIEDVNQGYLSDIKQRLNNNSLSTKSKILLLTDNFTIFLQGFGRRFTKDEQYHGNFLRGKLSGKGIYKNFKLQYQYEGIWLQGTKNGKGIQRTKLTHYQGQFSQNKKNGEGTLIFYISTQQQRQRQNEQKKFDNLTDDNPEYKKNKQMTRTEMALEEKGDRLIKTMLSENVPNYKGQQLLTLVTQKQQLWEIKDFPFVNRAFIENLKFQQFIKTNFVQKYSGNFSNDLFHGKGTYQWSRGNFYIGDWVDGKMQGVGKFYWKQGYSYFGEYKNDLKHGKGEMKWDPYKRHRGNWAFGKKHGYGEEIKIEVINQKLCVSVKAGLWKNNTLSNTDIYWQRFFPINESLQQFSIFLTNIEFYSSDLKLSEQMKKRILDQRTKKYCKKPCQICGSYFLLKENDKSERSLWGIGVKEGGADQDRQPAMCQQCRSKVEALEEVSSPRMLKIGGK